jgi:hypothetical protein
MNAQQTKKHSGHADTHMTKDYLRVRKLLRGMGKTAEEVAETVRKTGKKCPKAYTGYTDPIALYLHGQGITTAVDVGSRTVFIGDNYLDPVKMPKAVQDFVSLFDDGEFPDLRKTR